MGKASAGSKMLLPYRTMMNWANNITAREFENSSARAPRNMARYVYLSENVGQFRAAELRVVVVVVAADEERTRHHVYTLTRHKCIIT